MSHKCSKQLDFYSALFQENMIEEFFRKLQQKEKKLEYMRNDSRGRQGS